MKAAEVATLVAGWPPDWSEHAGRIASRSQPTQLPDETARLVCSEVRRALDASFGAPARNWTLLGLALSGGTLVSLPRFSELFRPSNFAVGAHRKLDWVLKRAEAWARTHLPGVAPNLRSWQNFVELSERARQDEHQLLTRTANTQGSLALMLAFVEDAFTVPPLSKAPSIIPEELSKLSPEDLAEAASFVVAKLAAGPGLKLKHILFASTPSAVRSISAELLLLAHSLAELRDLEIGVFRLGYRVTKESDRIWRVEPPSPAFGMALHYGYAVTYSLANSRRATPSEHATGAMSFFDFCTEFEQAYKGVPGPPLYQVVGVAEPRLRLEMRTDVAELLTRTMLSDERMFREELIHIANASHELMVSADDLWSFPIADGCTVGTLFGIARILRFYGVLRRQELSRLRDVDEETYIRSMLPGDSVGSFGQLLEAHKVEAHHVDTFMRFCSWSTEQRGHLDLQYTPVLRVDGAAVLLPMTLLNSDIFRNVLVHSKRRPFDDSRRDPLTPFVHQAMAARFAAKQNLHYKYQGVVGEIDVIAFSENMLFVFECKNSLLPCSAFEQRTLLDQLDKAVEQLNRITRLWQDVAFRTYLRGLLGWDLGNGTTLRTAIVPSVRPLSGIHYRDHPVRHARELVNFVKTGKASLRSPDGEVDRDLWGGREFSAPLLADYLDEHSSVYVPMRRSATKTSAWLLGHRWAVEQVAYGFHVDEYLGALRGEGAQVNIKSATESSLK